MANVNESAGTKYKILLMPATECIKAQDKKTEKYISDFKRGKDYLWADLSSFDKSATITANYKRVLELVFSYTNQNSEFYENGVLHGIIEYSLEFLHKNYYGKKLYYGNWWDFEIGVPLTLLKILFLVTVERKEEYLKDILYHQPNPFMSGYRANGARPYSLSVGANRIDTAKIALFTGLLKQDESLINEAKTAIIDVFAFTEFSSSAIGEKRDGLYRDFSFIQHGDIAYTGTYGAVLLTGIAEIFYVMSEDWDIDKLDNVINIFDMVLYSFFPVMHNLAVMDMVNGRGATRKEFQSIGFGCQIMSAIILLSLSAPESYKYKYKSFVKKHLSYGRFDTFKQYAKSGFIIKKANKILQDINIKISEDVCCTHSYNYMKRLVSIRNNFTFALALNSKHIRPYEYMLNENKQGFYSSDGAYNIYTEDENEYTGNYVATKDPYKIPGATIKDLKIPDGSLYHCSKTDSVFTMSINNCYGVAMYELDKRKPCDNGKLEIISGIDTYAKKSYFILDDEIVALGTDIKGANTKTYIDTRKIDKNNSKTLSANKLWFKNFGYISKHDFTYKEYTQNRSYFDINSAYSKELIKQDYASIYLSHNDNNFYEYIIIPQINQMDFDKYCIKYTLLQNDKFMQGIKYKNFIFLNFWQAHKYDYVQTDGVCLISIQKEKDIILMTIIGSCNKITVNKKVKSVISLDARTTFNNECAQIFIPYNKQTHIKLVLDDEEET